jgi:hypothetical protein
MRVALAILGLALLWALGRSQGCPALSPAAASRVIGLIGDGTVVFAYHPLRAEHAAKTTGG